MFLTIIDMNEISLFIREVTGNIYDNPEMLEGEHNV